jgi:diguanylate cyclase (GGDEF)-like protein
MRVGNVEPQRPDPAQHPTVRQEGRSSVREYDLSGVLTEFAMTLVTDYSTTGILDHLVTRIVEVLPVSSAGVTLIEAGKGPRYIAASDADAAMFEQLQTDLAEGPCVESYSSGLPVLVPDLAEDRRFPAFGPAAANAGLVAVFAFPLHHGDRRFGALDLYGSSPGPLDEAGVAAAQTLANVVSAYLINAHSRELRAAHAEEMRHVSTHDGLTGLPNMLLLRQRIDHAARRARRSQAPAAVVFIDLDEFKLVNDTHGHLMGDQVLRAVAERLSGLVRPGDTLARIYGDEFVLLCEDLHDAADAYGLVERVERSFDSPFAVGASLLPLSASVGIAYAGPGAEISEALVSVADRAMYTAKRRGRTDRQDQHDRQDRRDLQDRQERRD